MLCTMPCRVAGTAINFPTYVLEALGMGYFFRTVILIC